MAAYTRKQYSGAARNTTTTTLLTNVGTTVDIAATTGWPSIAGIPFYIVINPSSIYEEKCLATISGSTLTLVRAQDDTTASEHQIGSVIYPVFTANDADEANELVSKLTTKGDLLVTDGTNLLRLGVGVEGYFLKASNSASAGVEWASIPTINSLDDIGDVTISDVEEGDFLVYNNSASAWINETIHFITVSDTAPTDEIKVGDFWYNSSELELYTYYSGSWVQVTLTPEFLKVEELDNVYIDNANTGDVLAFDGLDWYNDTVTNLLGGTIAATTAETLDTPRVISLSGDVSGSVSFDGSQDVSISTTVQINSITLGTDTNGNYMSGLSVQNGLTVSHTPGEGSSATVGVDNALLSNFLLEGASGNSYGLIGTSAYLDVKNTNGYNKEIELDITAVKTQLNTDGYITESSTSTLTNKTLTSPIITGVSPVITLGGDLSGSVAFTNLGNATLNAIITENSVALGTDTTGDYIASLVAGTNISISNNSGEGATPTISVSGSVGSVDSISSPDFIQFDTTYTPTALAPGKMQWDPDYGTLQLGMIGGNVNLQIGQEMLVYVYNDSIEGTTLTDGEMVFINGVHGDRPSVRRAGASNSIDTSKPIGMVTEPIPNHQYGFICISGQVNGLNTGAYNPGDILFLSSTEGQVTTVRPTPPTDVVFVGVVLRANNGNGAIWVAPQNGYRLTEMHDTLISAPTDGQFLRYNSASTVWVNDTINLGTDTTGNYMSGLTQGTGVTITHTPGEGSNATVAIGQAVGTSASVTFANVNATGDLVVGGDLTVNGTTTTLNTETLEIEDNIIVLNSNVSGSPLANAGVEVQRGTSDNVSIRWNETSDKWEITEDGSAYLEVATTADISAATLTSISEIPDVSTGYQIGATGPAGGIIFITPDTVGNSTGMYFEAAPSASQVQRSWATGGNQSSAVSGADATAIGFGSQNTIDIVAQSGNVSATSAAAYASGYEYGGFSDWFLPSLDELQELYANEESVAGLLGSNYWSSTEHSATQAKYENLGDGGQAFSAKSNALYVRPVRAFNSPASGDFLKWNGSYWTNDPNLPTVSVSNSTIDDNSASMLLTGITVDSYGRVTEKTSATHRKASTTVPGIIQYDGDKFDYSDGPFTIKANGIELGTDTTGNYMVNVSASTGISISHTQGEGSTATISTTGVQTLGAKAGNYTLAAGDAAETIIIMDSSSANDLTVPPASSVAFATGTSITVIQRGTGKTRILAGAGVTLLATPGIYLRARYSSCTMVKTENANEWFVIGDLAAS